MFILLPLNILMDLNNNILIYSTDSGRGFSMLYLYGKITRCTSLSSL